jgi:hypothetical protein
MKATSILGRAADLVGGDRAKQHGDAHALHATIARMWNVYLSTKPGRMIEATDVALMMALLKVARTTSGAHNEDNYVDGAGYLAIAGELAQEKDRAD